MTTIPHNTTPLDAESIVQAFNLKRQQAEELLAQAKAELEESIKNLFESATTKEAKLQLASDLYWQYPDIQPKFIAGNIGKVPGALAKALPPSYRVVPCKNASLTSIPEVMPCHNEVKILVKNRDAARPENLSALCDECKEIEQQHSAASMAKYRADRLAAVQALRAMPYSEYLKTDHWQALRRKALRKAEYRCQGCNTATELQVHHRTYERRGEELVSDLTVFCDECHSRMHAKLFIND